MLVQCSRWLQMSSHLFQSLLDECFRSLFSIFLIQARAYYILALPYSKFKTKSTRNRVIVLTTWQKFHHALCAKLRCDEWAFCRQGKGRSRATGTTKKLPVRAKCPIISFRSWTLFRMEWTWLTLLKQKLLKFFNLKPL